MIRFRCKECGKKLKATEEIVGRQVKCTRCDSVETVPEVDNVAKPKQPETRLTANKPKSPRFKTDPLIDKPKTFNLDQPVELFGHSAASSASSEHFEPKFKVVTRKQSNLRRWMLLGFIGIFVVATVAVLFNLNWILDGRRKLSTDYENLHEVVYYRNVATRLEKSRRFMYIAGRTFIAMNAGTDEDIKELEEYNATIEALTNKSDMYETVESLFRRGKDDEAKALLIKTARELKQHQIEVEKKTREYDEKTDATRK